MVLTSAIQKALEALPSEAAREVEDFVLFLFGRYNGGKRMKRAQTLSLNWSGSLKELGKKTTSVDLQHKLLESW